MGTTVHLIGVGARERESSTQALLEIAEARVHDLEARWSRFRPTSELSRINERAGTRTTLTPETFDLVAAAVDGWNRTGGLFDPTLLSAVEQVGYDRSFDELPADRPMLASPQPAAPSAGCGAVELDPDSCTVRMPEGTRLDLGGIAKGYTADIVSAELVDAGLDGACANLGGDVRVRGTAPGPFDPTTSGGRSTTAWTVDIQDPTCDTASIARLEIDDGAIVTSTRLRRRWLVDGAEHHHLIDPRTRRSAFNGWAQVSVVAGTATEAEVLVKALFLGGPSLDLLDLLDVHDARAVLVADDGHVETIGLGSRDPVLSRSDPRVARVCRTVRGGWTRGIRTSCERKVGIEGPGSSSQPRSSSR
jgi:FAD:protein FMN transferase